MSDLKVDGVIASTGTNTNLTLEGKGTGGVKITDYLIQTKGGDIASDTALTLGKDGNQFDVTGTTTITSIATQGIGSYVTLHFDGVLTFTHHSTNLILPGAANITTATGDIAVMYEYASADWRCVSYTKASGVAVVVASAGFTDGGVADFSSGTGNTWGSIASGTKLIVISFNELSFSGEGDLDITLGDSGGLETTGYVSNSVRFPAAGTNATSTSEFIFTIDSGFGHTGQLILALSDGDNNTWVANGVIRSTTVLMHSCQGYKSLSAELTQVRVSGDTGDAGSANLIYM